MPEWNPPGEFIPEQDAYRISAPQYDFFRKVESEVMRLNRRLRLREEALQEVVKACDADCGTIHIMWLAKEGLK